MKVDVDSGFLVVASQGGVVVFLVDEMEECWLWSSSRASNRLICRMILLPPFYLFWRVFYFMFLIF